MLDTCLAALGLFDPASLTPDDVRAICATALARVPDHRQTEIVQARPIYEQFDMALAMVRLTNQQNANDAESETA
jgi:hypothetical protein